MLFKKKGNPEKKYVSVLKLTKLIFGESLTMVVYRVSKKFFSHCSIHCYSVCHVHFIRLLGFHAMLFFLSYPLTIHICFDFVCYFVCENS